jgi:hypothetical protein
MNSKFGFRIFISFQGGESGYSYFTNASYAHNQNITIYFRGKRTYITEFHSSMNKTGTH